MKVKVMDEDVGTSEEIGSCQLNAADLNIITSKTQKNDPIWYTLMYKGKPAG